MLCRVCLSIITRLHEITESSAGGLSMASRRAPMISSNAINRTFRLKHGDAIGTGFTIDVASRQYVVTAHHVVAGLLAGDEAAVEIHHDGDWKPLLVQIAWLAEPPVDVAILAPQQQLSHANTALEPTPSGISVGQQVYFLGFTEMELLAFPDSAGFPMPLVRQGILAGVLAQSGPTVLVIDGHNIPGFSGGPVVFKPEGSSEFRVAGVVSAYRTQSRPVFLGEEETEYSVAENSGLVIAYAFQEGINHIMANPTGVEIRATFAADSSN